MQTMLQSESNTPRTIPGTPTVCPICWDHDISRVDEVRLSANRGDGQDEVRAAVYRCAGWHLFAVFDQQ
jgi:hypothetical protein